MSENVPDKLVVLTFDDGCKSDIQNVAPLLAEHLDQQRIEAVG